MILARASYRQLRTDLLFAAVLAAAALGLALFGAVNLAGACAPAMAPLRAIDTPPQKGP